MKDYILKNFTLKEMTKTDYRFRKKFYEVYE